jgi:CheY-like chemotaxis protein
MDIGSVAFFACGPRNSPTGVSQNLRGAGLAPAVFFGAGLHNSYASVAALLGRPYGGLERPAGGRMPKTSLVSVVEDDRYFRESMGRLMRSLGYSVEAFQLATDFLASPRLAETACLVTDVHMPGMTGIELYRHLVNAGHAIPTILVTAYPDDTDRARALNDGVICYLPKPLDESRFIRCLRAALQSGEPPEANS